jgi:tetratricopeptide (TPR) repeat protein|tara:strand:- start:305 stop:850 length:546 start_codon:yes stop_codon:yes gene_type:complete
MKKLFFIILILFVSSNLSANDRNAQLDKLFLDLKKNDYPLSSKIEQQIWLLWSTHPTNESLTSKLNEGAILLQKRELFQSISIFTEVIKLDPSWAEAWNKRATAYYMIGEFQKSQMDIDEVLKLEKRHFGALAGQGLVNIQLKNYEKALNSYKMVEEIYPSMKSPKIMIKEIQEFIKNQSI